MTPLRQRMTEDMEIRNLSRNTQLSYLQQVSSFANFFQRSPELFGPDDIRTYQVHVTTERKLAPARLCIIASALRFLYKVTLKREWVDAEIPLPKKPRSYRICSRSPVWPNTINVHQKHWGPRRFVPIRCTRRPSANSPPQASASSPRRCVFCTRSPSSANGSTQKSRCPRNHFNCR